MRKPVTLDRIVPLFPRLGRNFTAAYLVGMLNEPMRPSEYEAAVINVANALWTLKDYGVVERVKGLWSLSRWWQSRLPKALEAINTKRLLQVGGDE